MKKRQRSMSQANTARAVGEPIDSRSRGRVGWVTQRILWGVAVLLVVAAFRLPWLEDDGGNAAFWTYGFMATDEAGYTSGGRIAYLSGHFYDPDLVDPHTFSVTPVMHGLAALGYLCYGLGLGAARLPVMMGAVLGWGMAYILVSRRTVPWLAGVLTIILSCNPFSLTYERLASTDVVVGVFMVSAFVLVTSRRWGWAGLAGVCTGLALGVKLTALGLLPLVVLGSLLPARHRWWRVAGFALGTAICLAAIKLWVHLELAHHLQAGFANAMQEAGHGRVSVEFKIEDWLKGLLIFPRWPFSSQLGALVIWLIPLPAWLVCWSWCVGRRWLTLRSVLGLGLTIFLLAIATQAHSPLRFLASCLYLVPLLLVLSRRACLRTPCRSIVAWGSVACGAVIILILFWYRPALPAPVLARYLHGEYNLPQEFPLAVTWFTWLISAVILCGLVVLVGPSSRTGRRRFLPLGTVGFLWLILSNQLFFQRPVPTGWYINQLFLQLATVILLAVLLAGWSATRWRWWYGHLLVVFLLAALLNSHWRDAYVALARRSFTVRDTVAQLAEKLPPDCIAVGRRAPSLLRATRMRLGVAMPGYPEDKFAEYLVQLVERYPDRPVLWLLESDAMPWYYPSPKDLAQRLKLEHVATLNVPGDGSPRAIPVYILRVSKLRPRS